MRDHDNAHPADDGARRRRPLLLTLATLGAVTGLLGGLGVFAEVFDRSTTGTNSYETGGYVELDLQLAAFDPVTLECGPFSDDLTTGIFEVVDHDLDSPVLREKLCARNVGERDGTLEVTAIDVLESEVGCTGAEAASDATCGTGPGELASALRVGYEDCDGDGPVSYGETSLLGATIGLDELASGSTRTFCLTVSADDDPETRRAIQSDRVEWRYAFDLVAPDDEPACPEDEPTDATPTLQRAVSVDGVLCPGDEDYFTFHHGGGTVVVDLDLTGEPAGELRMHVAGPLDYEESNTLGGDEVVFLGDAPAGRYSVVVLGEGITGPNPYRITALLTPATCTDDGHEPNDVEEAATPLVVGSTTAGVICGNDDVYVVQIGSPEAPVQFRLTLDYQVTGGSVNLIVTDPALETMVLSTPVGPGRESLELAGTGTMYVYVTGAFGADNPGYTLQSTILA